MKIEEYVSIYEKEENNVKNKIKKFFLNTKDLDDSKIHDLSNELNIDTHKFEGIIYSML